MNVNSEQIGRGPVTVYEETRHRRPRRRDALRIALTAALFLAGTMGIALPPAQTGTFYSDDQPFVPGAMRDVRAISTSIDHREQVWTTTSAAAADVAMGDVPVRDERAYIAAERRCALAQTQRARERCE